MELIKTHTEAIDDSRKRITGLVKYEDGFEEDYWFEFPAKYDLSDTGNPWLVALLPLAATLGEDLHIPLPVDPRLLDGASDILRIWKAWESGTSIIEIHADGGTKVIEERPDQSAVFFSMGIDSFYTVYKIPRVKHHILIHGFDLSVDKKEEFDIHHSRIAAVSDQMGHNLITVATNLRKTRWKKTRWESVSNGSSLAAFSLFLEKHFHEVFIASSHYDYAHLFAFGSHPLTDVLYSTTRTSLIHNGDGVSRMDKTRFLANFDLALNNLHVCIRGKDGHGQDETNCSHCEKCYRTMIALDLLGVLDKCKLFDLDRYNYEEVHTIFLNSPTKRIEYTKMAKLAHEQGKLQLEKQIYKCFRRSSLLRLVNRLEKTPILWRIAHAMSNNSIY